MIRTRSCENASVAAEKLYGFRTPAFISYLETNPSSQKSWTIKRR